MSGFKSDEPVSDEELGLIPPTVKEEPKVEPEEESKDDMKADQKKADQKVDGEEVEPTDSKKNVEEEESDSDEDQEEDEKPKRKDTRVPYSRFKEKSEEVKLAREELERERKRFDEDRARLLEEIKAKAPAAPEKKAEPAYDFDAKEEEYVTLMKEMEYDAAKKLRKEINMQLADKASKDAEDAAERRMSKHFEEQEAKRAQVEQEKMAKLAQKLVSQVESRHDFLDAKSDSFNKKAVMLFNAELQDLLGQGFSMEEAFKIAEDEVVPLFSKSTKGSSVTERNKAADKIAEEAAARIPPMTSKAGVGARSEDTPLFKSKNYTQKDWDNASEDDRLRALGLK